MTDIFKMPVHPAASIFPMIPDDELAELAEDIKANGLFQPIVVKDGTLIDGRNRREACRIAGITPEVQELNGADPVAYILSSNINRRHMTKGQRAMAVAKVCSETEQTVRQAAESGGVGYGKVSEANTVLKHSPDLADQVLSGSLSLDKAYKEATAAKEAAQSHDFRFQKIQRIDPDLASLVTEERITLESAETEIEQREEKAKAYRDAQAMSLYRLADCASIFSSDENIESMAAYMKQYRMEYEQFAKRDLGDDVGALFVISDRIYCLLEQINIQDYR